MKSTHYPASATALAFVALLSSTALIQAQESVSAAGKAGAVVDPAPAGPVALDPNQSASNPGSSVRIVRLSQTKGEVQLDRNNRGYEPAFTNLPIVQGSRLKTAEGVAEVEFEDNSTLRLTPNTVVVFPQLRLQPTGATLSTIRVLQGMVYISLAHSKANEVQLLFDNHKAVLSPAAHVELALNAPATRLAVLDGTAQLLDAQDNPSTTVSKKHSVVFDGANATEPTLIAKVEKAPFDEWDKTQAAYHNHYSNASAFGGTAGYGTSDLNYYGGFADLPGCGSVWRPYFASAAWDPFSNGTLAYYQGAGYSWVSPYPWGWAPFHSGAWQQCGTSGWGWRPGGSFVGLQNTGTLPTHAPGRIHPPKPPVPGQPGLIAVNTRPVASSGRTGAETFVFNKDSAGLGVPRQTFGKLGSVSHSVEHHGPVVTSITPAPSLAGALSQRQPVTVISHQNTTAPMQANGASRGAPTSSRTSSPSVSSASSSRASSISAPMSSSASPSTGAPSSASHR